MALSSGVGREGSVISPAGAPIFLHSFAPQSFFVDAISAGGDSLSTHKLLGCSHKLCHAFVLSNQKRLICMLPYNNRSILSGFAQRADLSALHSQKQSFHMFIGQDLIRRVSSCSHSGRSKKGERPWVHLQLRQFPAISFVATEL